MYRFKNPIVSGRLIQRMNRFVAAVEVQGEIVHAHVANSGRMKELLFPGNRVVLEYQPGKERKTPYDLIVAEYNGFLVSVDSRLPNLLVAEAIQAGELPGLEHLTVERREVGYGESRLDLKLIGRQTPASLETAEGNTNGPSQLENYRATTRDGCMDVKNLRPGEGYAEIKSCTLVNEGIAMFPDAPTERGARHVRELIRARQEGYVAYVIFLVQREDAYVFQPNDSTDPEFGTALREAANAGVQIKAYTCRVTVESVNIIQEIPVRLSISI